VQRARQFNKELRRARSFRGSRERSCSRSRAASADDETDVKKVENSELSFNIRKHLGAKSGWLIMPDDEAKGFKPDSIRKVADMIKTMELSGHAVPERITIKV